MRYEKSKYVKTKNEIYEVVGTDLCLRYEVGSGKVVDKFEVYICKNGDPIPFHQVIAVADTIEELL